MKIKGQKLRGNKVKVKFKMNALMSTWPGGWKRRDNLNTNSAQSEGLEHSEKSGKLRRLSANEELS